MDRQAGRRKTPRAGLPGAPSQTPAAGTPRITPAAGVLTTLQTNRKRWSRAGKHGWFSASDRDRTQVSKQLVLGVDVGRPPAALRRLV